MRSRILLLATALAASRGVQAASLKDIKHIVLFMQENRAFDHVCRFEPGCGTFRDLRLRCSQYYGTMAGVRGFADPNVQVNPDGRSVFEQ